MERFVFGSVYKSYVNVLTIITKQNQLNTITCECHITTVKLQVVLERNSEVFNASVTYSYNVVLLNCIVYNMLYLRMIYSLFITDP